MNWKKLFDKKTLAVGNRYFEKGCVSGYVQVDNMIYSEVDTGKERFAVQIENPGKDNMKMHCSCYFAFSGLKCYHMAATMFRWEQDDVDIVYPGYIKAKDVFPKIKNAKKPFFFIPDILEGYCVSKADHDKALSMIENNKLKKIKDFKTDYVFLNGSFDKGRPALEVVFSCEDGGSSKRVEIVVCAEEIYQLKCWACGKSLIRDFEKYYYTDEEEQKKLCSHILAGLILTDEYTRLYDPGDATDKKADLFLGYFKREKEHALLDEEEKKSGNVVIIPRITDNGREYEVSFKIGNGGKFYIVKNLKGLYNAVKKRESYTLGKSCEIDFTRETFDERSSGLFGIIEKKIGDLVENYNRNVENNEFYRDIYDQEIKRSLIFSGSILDYIFENFQNEKLDFKAFDGYMYTCTPVKSFFSLVEVNIEFDGINKKKKGDGFSTINVSGYVPDILLGDAGKYVFTDGRLSRIDEDTWAIIKPFWDAADHYDGEFSFEIGNKKATEFYYGILPMLRENPVFEVYEDERNASDIMPEAEFVFYLDVDEGCIICSAQAKYEDVTDPIVPYEYEKLPLLSYRDTYREDDIRKLLDDLFEGYDPEKKVYFIEDDDDMKYEFMRRGVRRLISRGETKGTDSFNALKIRKSTPVSFGVSIESDLLNLDIKTEDMEPEELLQILDSYKRKKRYHRLRNGDFVELEGNASLESFLEMTDLFGVDAKDYIKGHLQIPAYRALYLDKMLEEHEELAADRDKTFKSVIKNFKTIKESEFEVPKGMQETLRSYQEYGYKWLKTLENAGFGGILADDMGLGKTLQLITLLESSKTTDGVNSLVICPASLVYNWTEEIKKFAPGMKTAALAGTKPERKKLLSGYKDFDVLVTSYDLLKRDIDLYEDKIFTHQILDEAQYIKNAKAQAAKAVKLIKAKHRFALTGTPIENRLSELWSIFDFLMPGFLYGYERFKKDFELPITKNGDDKAMDGLKKMVFPFLLRRKKSDVLKDLPDKVEEVLYAGMETKQRRLYDAQVARIVGMVRERADEFDKNKIAILAEITKTRQICCDPGLLFEDYDGESAKRDVCMELVENVADGGHKMLLFSQFTSMLELLEEDLKAAGLKYYKITGSTPKEERVKLVKAFNGDDTPVFLISLKAGGTGLNLTGADIVIHFDPWWNTAAQDQATDRAHRIGQTKKVTVYRIIAKDTIEEKILQLQETKKELADSVLSGETRSLGSMTKEELLDILGG